jgi:hypothetical protein
VKTAHLDYETLADLAEGLLDDEQAASANDHLVDCAECLDRSADLADVSRLLAAAPVPPLPIELAERIDSAIAAEAFNSPAAIGASSHRRHLRLLSAAAAALVAVGGGTLVGRELLRSSTSPEYTKSQAAQDPGVSSAGSGADHGSASGQQLKTGKQGTASGGYRLIASGTDYSGATLGRQLGAAVKSSSDGIAISDIGVQECVARIAKSRDPVLVDRARYNGHDATLIVLPGSGPHLLDVWVVGPKCSAATPDVITHTQAAD